MTQRYCWFLLQWMIKSDSLNLCFGLKTWLSIWLILKGEAICVTTHNATKMAVCLLQRRTWKINQEDIIKCSLQDLSQRCGVAAEGPNCLGTILHTNTALVELLNVITKKSEDTNNELNGPTWTEMYCFQVPRVAFDEQPKKPST